MEMPPSTKVAARAVHAFGPFARIANAFTLDHRVNCGGGNPSRATMVQREAIQDLLPYQRDVLAQLV